MLLDKQQEQAVKTDKSKVIVVAGAGSGKTRVITERVKFLLESGVQPHNIVAITFTNLASEEMRERLADVPGISDAFIGTIHSFANRVLRASGESYKIFNDDVEDTFMRVLIKKYCTSLSFARYLEYKDLMLQVNRGKKNPDFLESFFNRSEAFEHRRVSDLNPKSVDATFKENMGTLCVKHNIVTFDVLLLKAKDFFDSQDAKLEHLLVDEFQDIGDLEYKFIMSLDAKNTFFVGDDWQAIYGFKGGVVEYFLKLTKSEEYTTYMLETNYRSGEEILNLAKVVIEQVDSRLTKTVLIHEEERGDIVFKSKFDADDFFERFKPKKLKDWFILVRSNKELFVLSEILTKHKIPYSSFRKGDFSLKELSKALEADTVKLLTVHSAKGLESENVVLYGNFPVRCPSYRTNDEERRVMYVGITRAKKHLILMN